MTWYWWKHWFWITGVLTISAFLLSIVETFPITPIYKEYKKDKALKFPLAGPTDIDNIFNGNDDMPLPGLKIIHRDNQIPGSLDKENEEENHNSKTRDHTSIESTEVKNSSKTLVISKAVVKNISNNFSASEEVNRTKGADYSIINNSICSNNCTNSSLQLNEDTSQSIIIASNDERVAECNTATSQITQSSNRTINNSALDCENDTNADAESEEESQQNNTTTVHVDLINYDNIDHDDNDKNDGDEDNTNVLVNNKGKSLENITKEEEISRAEIERQLEGERGRKSKLLAEYTHGLKYINFSSDTKNLLARSAAVALDFDEQDDGNVSSEALAIQKAYILDAGTISGICLTVLGLCLAVTYSGIVLYRRRYLNKPQTLSEPDSSGYIDDSTIRDNSDEMYSLDNDSFLNSLEAMTIQNYWTDTVKHTKL